MQIPAAYAAILTAVREAFPGSLIAGGALRDLDNGRPVKDIDVFAPNCNSFDDLYHRATHCLPEEHFATTEFHSYEDWCTREVVGVLNVESPFGPYQLIGLSTGPETIIPRLDFGICQIGYDGLEVVRSVAYEADKARKTFTLTRCDDERQRDRSVRRYGRLSAEKYAGWSFVDLEPFADLTVSSA